MPADARVPRLSHVHAHDWLVCDVSTIILAAGCAARPHPPVRARCRPAAARCCPLLRASRMLGMRAVRSATIEGIPRRRGILHGPRPDGG